MLKAYGVSPQMDGDTPQSVIWQKVRQIISYGAGKESRRELNSGLQTS